MLILKLFTIFNIFDKKNYLIFKNISSFFSKFKDLWSTFLGFSNLKNNVLVSFCNSIEILVYPFLLRIFDNFSICFFDLILNVTSDIGLSNSFFKDDIF